MAARYVICKPAALEDPLDVARLGNEAIRHLEWTSLGLGGHAPADLAIIRVYEVPKGELLAAKHVVDGITRHALERGAEIGRRPVFVCPAGVENFVDILDQVAHTLFGGSQSGLAVL